MKISIKQQGFTLVECMIALTLGMIVILASTALLLSAQKTYLAIDDNARISDTGAFALAVLGTAIRQTAYADRSAVMAPPEPPLSTLLGIDDTSLKMKGPSFDQTRAPSVNSSDVLITRFMAVDADGTVNKNMLNCAGQRNKHKGLALTAEAAYNWSIFYIVKDKANEPELFCRYRTARQKFKGDAIARGIESMHLSYGVDMNEDGLPDTFLKASAIADWTKVTAVHIALSIHGTASGSGSKNKTIHRFNSIVMLRNRFHTK